jgi:hypothetical protein
MKSIYETKPWHHAVDVGDYLDLDRAYETSLLPNTAWRCVVVRGKKKMFGCTHFLIDGIDGRTAWVKEYWFSMPRGDGLL